MHNIEIFPWNENFATGIELIDAQHKQLVKLLNSLVGHLAFQSDAPALNQVFDELKNYAAVHFRDEEAIWHQAFGDDPWDSFHRREHRNFIDQVLELKARETPGGHEQVIEEVVTFLTHWLALHIIESDRHMAKVVLLLHAGTPLQQAKGIADEEMTGATRVLIETVMGMYDKLANRTVQLTREINKRVKVETELLAMQAEMARLRDEAVAANRAKSAFLATMSHEIRTPMNAIIGMSQLALNTALTPKQQNYIEKVNSSAHSLLSIINDILDFSKVEAGRLTLETAEFNLQDELETLSDMLAYSAQNKGLELIVRLAPSVPSQVLGDSLRLRQVLLNLVNNAIKFTAAGEVMVAVDSIADDEQGHTLQFSVHDTGIGMTPEQMSLLFVPFHQGDASTTRNFGGTGLGLAIAKRLIEMMGGAISVESVLDRGSVFRFTVRLGHGANASTVANQGDHLDLRGLRCLVVDDQASARRALVDMISALGMVCSEAPDGDWAMAMVRHGMDNREPVDLVLMDWRMSGLDGLAAAENMRSVWGERCPPIVLMSGFDRASAEEALVGRHTSIRACLAKPVLPSRLLQALGQALGRSAPLPLAPKAAQRVADEFRERLRGMRVLVVDDTALNRELIVSLLADAGIDAELASDGAAAVAAALARCFDIVLMDVHMPVMDGLTATRQIRSAGLCREVPILAMTAKAFDEDEGLCLASGMSGVVTKPIDARHLYAALVRWAPAQKPAGASAVANAAPALDDGAESARAHLANLPCLDVAQGLRAVNGRPQRLLHLLQGFVRDHSGDAHLIGQLKAQGRDADARRCAHTLKGLAGTLGLNPVMQEAAAIEAALMAGREAPGSALEALKLVMNALALGLAEAPPASAPVLHSPFRAADLSAVDWANARVRVQQLRKSLLNAELNSAKECDRLGHVLKGAAGDLAQRLEAQIKDFNFEAALDTLDLIVQQEPRLG